MKESLSGVVFSGVGGLYAVRLSDGTTVSCRARGVFRHEKSTVLAGDRVLVAYEENKKESGHVIDRILARKNELPRPAVANLDVLLIAFAATKPEPDLLLIDKLTVTALSRDIRPVILITKADLDKEKAAEYADIYRKAGFSVLLSSRDSEDGVNALRALIEAGKNGLTYAFAGASGVGKSTFLNRIFPSLSVETGAISEKAERGKHTTRAVRLFETAVGETTCYVADTPGFSLLDFVAYTDRPCEELAPLFPEFRPFLGTCRWDDCTHTKEDDCAVRRASAAGQIAESRMKNYRLLYEELRAMPEWKRKSK